MISQSRLCMVPGRMRKRPKGPFSLAVLAGQAQQLGRAACTTTAQEACHDDFHERRDKEKLICFREHLVSCGPWGMDSCRDYFCLELQYQDLDTADVDTSPAASQRKETVPAPAGGPKLQDLFVQPRRTVRAKRSQLGAGLLKPAPARTWTLRPCALLSRLCLEFEKLKTELRDRGCWVGVPPSSPPVAGSPPASSPQQELQRLLQDQERKFRGELEQLRENMKCHAAATQQSFQSQEKELYGALRCDFEADVGDMRQLLGQLDQQSRRSTLVIHTPTYCSRQQLLSRCSEALQS